MVPKQSPSYYTKTEAWMVPETTMELLHKDRDFDTSTQSLKHPEQDHSGMKHHVCNS
jgi:hypothetical protein